MVGYGEVNYDEFFRARPTYNPLRASPWSTLYRHLSTINHPRIVPVTIERREQVYEALREFLKVRES